MSNEKHYEEFGRKQGCCCVCFICYSRYCSKYWLLFPVSFFRNILDFIILCILSLYRVCNRVWAYTFAVNFIHWKICAHAENLQCVSNFRYGVGYLRRSTLISADLRSCNYLKQRFTLIVKNSLKNLVGFKIPGYEVQEKVNKNVVHLGDDMYKVPSFENNGISHAVHMDIDMIC